MAITRANSVDIASGATNNDVLNGTDLDYSPVSGPLAIYATASAVDLEVTVRVGQVTILDQTDPGSANRRPRTDQDLLVEDDFIEAGERIRIIASNPTGSSITLFYLVAVG